MARNSGWNSTAALLGGIAAGAAASRMLPPLIANVTGAMRVRMGDDPFGKLIRDHRRVEAVLRQMDEAVDSRTPHRAALLVLFKRLLSKHAMAEEDVVYPILYETAGEQAAAEELYSEHAQMKIQIYGLETSVASPSAWRERVRILQDVIGSHIRDEEDVQFPRLREIMSDGQTSLGGKILREEALVL